MPVIILFTAAIIWGTAFIAQSVGMDYLGPFSFNAIRFVIGGVTLLPVILISVKADRTGNKEKLHTESGRALSPKAAATWIGGSLGGIVLAAASMFQQIGIMGTTVGKIGFITSLYIIFVPLVSLFLGRRYHITTWLGIIISLCGFYLMCSHGGFSINRYDLLGLVAALMFAVHILVIDKYAVVSNPIAMSGIQFLVSGLICTVGAILTETVTWELIVACRLPLLYAGVLSCGVAYTLQIIGQSRMNPVLATLILSLESVISAVSGWIILNQVMMPVEIFGAVMVFAGVLMVQFISAKYEI